MAATELSIDEASEEIDAVIDEIQRAVIIDQEFLETVLVGLLSKGHVLLEDVPGTGKTLTANSFAKALGLSFSRIQFTPDLLPNDVTGTHIYNEKEGEFEFNAGPIFANVVLADEINRAPPKTQAALLEAMGEGQVTTEGETRQLPQPFFVIATQNPVEQEGTFPLPEAQVDRFNIKSSIGYPNNDGEVELLRRRNDRSTPTPTSERVLDLERVRAVQEVPERVTVTEDMLQYIAEVSRATRDDHRVSVGMSPRGTQRLYESARAHAVIQGRTYVTPDDVKSVSRACIAHRLVLTAESQVNDVDKSAIVEEVLAEIPVPTVEAPA
ncbi:MoxR family ATPase [Halobacteria archaeon AArc-m2/3/4]|uniref:MoxR family ATPase n=1 Tax=Natronoglomus mannanivorans TaxID=2979990 RepID=A0AAP2YYU2_9EURY|nr:MoxR family ATPase [Halobacteria archaeon AArc-xg1-1]MCU4972316.1 MoxR family ATPase [Halobacteria archaeon AArc-m2/3/4]